mmetsp:Transcript_7026/g.14407  ORF Transcript_7026/g.14407 Transcript_7026/m.14407 type:complete len:201 (+) Transcript_7026:262-864(+)
MLFPDDSCQPWKDVDVELDSNMIATRISAALSIVLGFLIWIYTTLVALRWSKCILVTNRSIQQRRCSCFATCLIQMTSNRCVKFLVALLALAVAVFQALTHLMVKSDLCEDAEPFEAVVGGRTAVYDTCEKDTPAYNLTFATMAMWVVLAIFVGVMRIPYASRDEEEDVDIETEDHPTAKNKAEHVVSSSSKHTDGEDGV